MSSWIVEDKSINFIVGWLRNASYSNEIFNSMVGNVLKENGFILNVEGDEPAQSLGYEMKKLNCLATGYRYKEDDTDELKTYKYEDVSTGFHSMDKNIYQLLKSIQCFLYQCSEGDYIKDKIYLMLEIISDIVKSEIIDNIPAYKKADWK